MERRAGVFDICQMIGLIGLCLFSLTNVAHAQEQEAKSWANQARDWSRARSYDSAAMGYGLASNEYKLVENWSEYVNCLSLQGNALMKAGEESKAEKKLLEAVEEGEARLAKNDPELAKAYNRLGSFYVSKTKINYPQARLYFAKSFQIKQAYPEKFSKRSLASSYLNYGSFLGGLGRLEESEDLLNKGLELLLAAKEENPGEVSPNLISIAYGMMAGALINKADYSAAIDFYKQSLDIKKADETTPPANLASIYLDLGRAYFYQGDSLQTLINYEQCLSLQLEHLGENDLDLAKTYLNLGAFYMVKKYENFPLAQSYLQKSESVFARNAVSQSVDLLNVYLNRAIIFSRTKELAQAHRYVTLAQQKAEELFSEANPVLAKIYLVDGIIFSQERNYQQAEVRFQEAQKLLFTDPSSLDLGKVYHQPLFLEILGHQGSNGLEAFQQSQDTTGLKSAFATFSLAAQLLDSIRIGLETPGAKEVLVGSAKEYYEQGIEVCWKLYEVEQDKKYLYEAFRFAERSKALLLREGLRESSAQEFADLPPALLDSIENLRQELETNQKLIFDARNNPAGTGELAELERAAFVVKQQYFQLIRQLEIEYPKYYQLKYDLSTVHPLDLQEKLREEQSQLYLYFAGERALYTFRLSADTIQWFRNSMNQDFQLTLDSLRQSLSDRAYYSQGARSPIYFQQFCRQSHALYQWLLPNLSEEIGERLLIIPDGKLGYLPFEILLSQLPPNFDSQPDVNYGTLSYLLKDFAISYEYAASFYMEERELEKDRRQYAGFAPHYPMPVRGEAPVRNELNSEFFGPLSFNQHEIETVAEEMGGKEFLAEEATEAIFRKYAGRYRILHLAMHAFTQDVDPAFSGLVFSPVARTDSMSTDNDGWLYVSELYNLRLKTELVVLSACNTGRGKLVRGEGIFSLARAFKYAGCPNIVMSLWQVDDRSTEQISTEFFARIKAGLPKDQALREAKLQYLGTTNRNHPFYWAALVFSGDDEPIRFPSSQIGFILIGLLLILMTTAAWLKFSRRQRG